MDTTDAIKYPSRRGHSPAMTSKVKALSKGEPPAQPPGGGAFMGRFFGWRVCVLPRTARKSISGLKSSAGSIRLQHILAPFMGRCSVARRIHRRAGLQSELPCRMAKKPTHERGGGGGPRVAGRECMVCPGAGFPLCSPVGGLSPVQPRGGASLGTIGRSGPLGARERRVPGSNMASVR